MSEDERADLSGGTGEMTSRACVTEIYGPEDLLSVTAKLTGQFTSNESSSVSYERARSLMEAVIYCIRHFYENGRENEVAGPDVIPAEEAYKHGYRAVFEKVKKANEKYNELLSFFCAYGNRNYSDTVEKGLRCFFLYYDIKFSPMENIITMDYPVFGMNLELSGIDLIEQYIDRIYEEQLYLQKFQKDYIVEQLRLFHPNYEKEYFNLKEILEIQLEKRTMELWNE